MEQTVQPPQPEQPVIYPASGPRLPQSPKISKRTFVVITALLLVIGVPITTMLVRNQQDPRSRASELDNTTNPLLTQAPVSPDVSETISEAESPSPTQSATDTSTSQPTAIPTQTVNQQTTQVTTSGQESFSLHLFLHGIGKGGDNTAASASGNMHPGRPQRDVTVTFLNSSNVPVANAQGKVNFNGTLGSFDGTVATDISPGVYIARVKVTGFISRQFPGFVTIQSNTTTTLPSTDLVTGDINNDDVVDINDYNVITECYEGDVTPRAGCASDAAKKHSADLSDDGTVNSADFNIFIRELATYKGSDVGTLSTPPSVFPTSIPSPTHSPTATLTPTHAPTAMLGVSTSSVTRGGTVSVSWNNISGASPTDWLGLFTPGANSSSFDSSVWIYASSCSQTAGTAKSSGSCTFTIPADFTLGTYQFRLLAQDGFTAIATSQDISIGQAVPTATSTPIQPTQTSSTKVSVNTTSVTKGGTIIISWSGIANPTSSDWMAFYTPTAANSEYNSLAWMYTSTCNRSIGGARSSGSCSFTVPISIASGIYQIRLFSNNGYTLLARSADFTVQAAPTAIPTPTTAPQQQCLFYIFGCTTPIYPTTYIQPTVYVKPTGYIKPTIYQQPTYSTTTNYLCKLTFGLYGCNL